MARPFKVYNKFLKSKRDGTVFKRTLVRFPYGQRRQGIGNVSHLMHHRLGCGGGYGTGPGNLSQVSWESSLRLKARSKSKSFAKELSWRQYQYKDRHMYTMMPPPWKQEIKYRQKLKPIPYNVGL